MKFLWLLIAALILTGCDYTEVKREIGYKGKARVDPWLAAERFANRQDHTARSLVAWSAPTRADRVWFVPASVLTNETYTRQIENWVRNRGGHLVLLVEYTDSATSDWSKRESKQEISKPLLAMLTRMNLRLEPAADRSEVVKAEHIRFDGKRYKVAAESWSAVSTGKKKPGVFASVKYGEGRATVLTDARIFRNRWIDENQHADLLAALMNTPDQYQSVGFLRGAGLSLWGMLTDHLWPVLLALALLTLLWLWKNLTRFGPLEAESGTSELRGYDHHLEALGDFQWRLDRGTSLLGPLRAQIVERGQHLSQRAGRRDDDFFQFLADRANLPRERVFRALAEAAPPDPAILTRTTADLQRLLQVLH